MSQSSRLSDLIGIDRDATVSHQQAVTWPLTMVLVGLGATILWIAFHFLEVSDSRPLYNPWTYAIATPVALLVLSAILGTVASRVVERSMQIAFLLSVMIHLLMLVFATNIVIFSRMWPDVFEALAEQRETLQRQQQPAPQYHNLSALRAQRRPDHLRYVPTKHQASELPESNDPALQLAAAHKSELVSPQPELQRNMQPHLIPRENRQLSTPQLSASAAPLSRSESPTPRRLDSPADALEAPLDSPTPEPVRPTDTSPQRQSFQGAELRSEFAAASPSKAAAAKLERRVETVPPELSVVSSANPARQSLSSPVRRGLPLNIPASPTVEVAEPRLSANRQQPNATKQMEATAIPLSAPTISLPSRPKLPNTNPLVHRADAVAEMRVPQPFAGDSPSAFVRESAGGQTSAMAPRSMPIQGIATLAAPDSAAELNSSPSSLESRSTKAERANSRLPEIGLPKNPEFNPTPSLAAGSSGQSSSALPQRASPGQAVVNDIAGLTGNGSSIQKSAIGIAAATGPVSLPSGTTNDTRYDSTTLALAADSAGAQRQINHQDVYDHPATLDVQTPTTSQQGIPDGLTRVAQAAAASAPVSAPAESIALSRQGTDSRPQASKSIEVPDTSQLMEVSSPGDSVANAAQNAAQYKEATSIDSQLIINVDAKLGQGGLAEFSPANGPLIPRATVTPQPLVAAEIETQRFTKNEVGGPLAAGNSIPLPKPAYQQRIDRLKENQVFDDGITGPQTELAIESGLEFLAKHQAESGAWRLQDFDTRVLMRSDTAATGLSLLAFQGAGYTHRQYQYATHVGNALQFLMDGQKRDGDLYRPQDPASDQNAWLYSHAIATLALCEAYGMTQDPALREPAQRALNFMVTSQDKERGGWRYRPGVGTDTSVSGWFMMAFKSGQLAGLDVPSSTFDRIEKYLDASRVSAKQPHLFRYNPFASDTLEQRHGREPTAVMTSVGLLMRLYFGWRRNQPEMIAGAEYLLEHPPAPGTARRDFARHVLLVLLDAGNVPYGRRAMEAME